MCGEFMNKILIIIYELYRMLFRVGFELTAFAVVDNGVVIT